MPLERKGGDFGARLREARERKGVSLRQIAGVTRISIRVLEALEQNDISKLPGGIFSRAFVRSYAIEVGLDPEATVDEFLRQFPHDAVTAGHSAASDIEQRDEFESDQRMASVVVWIAAVSVPIAGGLLYLGMSGRPSDAGRGESASGPPGLARPASAQASRTDARLMVEVVARRAVSVSVGADGEPSITTELPAGARRAFEAARQLSLVVSDASAIDWSVNGLAGRALGPPGDRGAAHLTLENYQAYASPR
jgi:transcriptional regulator with XRE-family HTH domain